MVVRPARLAAAVLLGAAAAGLLAHVSRPSATAKRSERASPEPVTLQSAGSSAPAASATPPAADISLPGSIDPPAELSARPSFVYGAMTGDACMAEVDKRGIAVTVASGAPPSVDRPIRLAGPLHGVRFHGAGLAKTKGGSIFEIADCRLVLALDDFAAMLARRGIVEVEHFSMFRPAAHRTAVKPSKSKAPAKPARAKKGKHAKPQPKPKRAPPRGAKPSQHELALAIDAGAFVKADGTRLEVKRDWQGAIGAPPCQPVANEPSAAAELRSIVCHARAAGLFTVILTPNANEAHFDHFHLDITRDATWSLIE